MTITLNWNNRNQTVTEVRIYRGTVRESKTLLTTLTGNVSTHTDATATVNTLYYYQVSLVINGEEIPGSTLPMMSVSDTGPGPQALASGTMEWGYFGRMLASEFMTSADIRAQLPVATGWTTSQTVTFWRKYAYMGKILYIPDLPVLQSANQAPLTSIANLYSAGMLYGNNRSDKISYITATVTMQNVKVVKDQYEFIVRPPKSNYSNDPTVGIASSSVSEVQRSEIILVLMMNAWAASYVNISNGAAFPRVSPYDSPGAAYNYCITQHFNTSSSLHVFTSNGSNASSVATTGSNVVQFLPVLELVLG